MFQKASEPEKVAEREKELQVLAGAISQFEAELGGYQTSLGHELQLH